MWTKQQAGSVVTCKRYCKFLFTGKKGVTKPFSLHVMFDFVHKMFKWLF